MKQIYMNIMPEETRMAIIENGRLSSFELERDSQNHLVGNIYNGQIQNLLKGMQAAFVDIGQSKNAFLYVGDGKASAQGNSIGKREQLTVGQRLPVQIIKDEVGSKGPRATMHLSIPGRNVVLMPNSAYIGTSHKIDDEKERQRLFNIVKNVCPEDMGIIIRTAAVGQSQETLEKDIKYLVKLWESIVARSRRASGNGLLYRDADLVIRMVRDYLDEDVELIVLDSQREYNQVRELVQSFSPQMSERVELYTGEQNIFHHYGINDELDKLKNRQVELASGGFLVIDKTEALTVIDVNSGGFVGDINLSDTAYKLNLEAADEIMHQLRLRDIGGIILVDFIDMDKPAQNESLLERLRMHAQSDRSKTNVIDITPLGLVEITRKKSRRNLYSMLMCDCPACEGSGRVLSPETIGVRVCRHIRRLERKRHAADGYVVQLHCEAANELRITGYFDKIQRELGLDISIESSREIAPGTYCLVGK